MDQHPQPVIRPSHPSFFSQKTQKVSLVRTKIQLTKNTKIGSRMGTCALKESGFLCPEIPLQKLYIEEYKGPLLSVFGRICSISFGMVSNSPSSTLISCPKLSEEVCGEKRLSSFPPPSVQLHFTWTTSYSTCMLCATVP